MGIEPVAIDLFKPETFERLHQVKRMVVSAAPPRGTPANYDKLFGQAIPRFMTYVATHRPPEKLIYTSSTAVYNLTNGQDVDESTPVSPASPKTKALLASENSVLGSGIPSIVYRLGGIYGHERNRLERLEPAAPAGPEDKGFINLIRVEDAAASVLHLFRHGKAGDVYVGVDTRPVDRGELNAWIRQQMGWPASLSRKKTPRKTGRFFQNKRCSSVKLISTGYRFLYPTFEQGYGDIVHTALAKSQKATKN